MSAFALFKAGRKGWQRRADKQQGVEMQGSGVVASGSNHLKPICVSYASILRTKLTVKDPRASQGFADFQKQNMDDGKSYYFHVFSQWINAGFFQ